MTRPNDVPELPFEKPKQLIDLEKLTPDELNAMTQVEAQGRMEDAAYALAQAYREKDCGDQEGCILTVSTALQVTGGAIKTKVGALLVADSSKLAEEACRTIFTDDTLEY